MSRQPLQPGLMRNGFTKVGDFYFAHPHYFNLCSPHQLLELFQPYYKYCAEQTSCQQYCKEQDRDNQVALNISIMHTKITSAKFTTSLTTTTLARCSRRTSPGVRLRGIAIG